jgi:hypothetical protein
LIAAAQEQFRQQNPFYQAPPAPGEGNRDDAFDDDTGQTAQGQPMQGQPAPGQQNFGNSQPPYPPREQPQPYGGQQPHQQQSRPQQQHQPYNQSPQQFQQPQAQPSVPDANDGERLPSFITGSQPQQNPQGLARTASTIRRRPFPRHRRRRTAARRLRSSAAGYPRRRRSGRSRLGNS